MRRIARVWHDDVAIDDASVSGADHDARLDDRADSEEQPGISAVEVDDVVLPFVSVVVLARADEASLVRCLEALAGQTHPVARMEVIVVGLTAHDQRAAVVASQARRRAGLRLRYINCQKGAGVAEALNCGWRHARGDLVGFTADSAVPSADWIAAGASAFGPAVDVVGGMIVVPLPARPAASMREAARRLRVPWSATNVFYRRQLLTSLNGFDERLGDADYDATGLALAARAAGARLMTAERAVVVYNMPAPRWLAEVRRQHAHMDEARLFKRYPQLFRQHVRPEPPLDIYAKVGLLLVSMFGLLGRRRTLALAGSTAWLAVTIASFARAARGTSDHPRDLLDLLLTSALVPPVALAYRLRGALRERAWFL